jgi:DNA-binding transcriptional MerR regulator
VDEKGARLTIGELARRTGSTVRTIRFWSDSGLVPPTERTEGGYRLYDLDAVARIDLVRTLRDLGLGLEVVEQVLRRQVDLDQVVQTHARALDAQIRALRLRRAVLRTVAKRTSTIEEVALMHRLARLSAQERQQIVDRFVESVFAGIDPQAPGAGIAAAMRQMPAELPDDPTVEQVDAWVELAELVQDSDFQARVRQMALAGAAQGKSPPPAAADPALVTEHAGAALAAGVAPGSAEGKAVLDKIVSPSTPAPERARILAGLETFTDARVERYWQLMGIVNGREPFAPMVPTFQWVIDALRAHG